MVSLILVCLSILIVGIIIGVIMILSGSKCTPGNVLCDNNTASYINSIYNNKWLDSNSYVKEYPNDTSNYYMLRGKKDFITIPETSTYQPINDNITNCANYLSLQTDDNNYYIESNGNNSNDLICNIKHIDYNSDIKGNEINNNSNMITIINGIDSNETYFYKGLMNYALLINNGDTCLNDYNICMKNIRTNNCNDYKIGGIIDNPCMLDNTKVNAASDLCKRYAYFKTVGNINNFDPTRIPCGYFSSTNDAYKAKDVVDCARIMKNKNNDMATFDTTTKNCYYRNFPPGNPYNYLIFRK